jgi:hypothetical protein
LVLTFIYLAPINSSQALAHTAHDFAQAAIGAIFGYWPHSLPHASQAFLQASAAATAIGPLRAQIFSHAAQSSMQSRESSNDFWCCFMPAFTMSVQCRLHAWQVFAQSAHAFAHLLYRAADGAADPGPAHATAATAAVTDMTVRSQSLLVT